LPKYSEILPIEKKLCEKEIFLAQRGIFLEKTKDISYGVQILAKGQTDDGKFTVYFSDKKGLSIVDNSSNDVSKEVIACLNDEREIVFKAVKKIAGFIPHFGSDEAGKGDFFGPLITAGFCMENEEVRNDLVNMGVCDSKKLNDRQICELAKKLHAKYKNNIAVIQPSVEKYNNLYTSFNNLNLLLGWSHARVMEELKDRFEQINLAIFDKFAEKSVVTRFLKKYKDLNVEALVHGEDRNIAIAAASIIARDCFVRKMGDLSRTYGIKIPFGAGNIVIKVGKEFVKKYGKKNLINVAKTHFKTMRELE
jgi:ribonuclease HIII